MLLNKILCVGKAIDTDIVQKRGWAEQMKKFKSYDNHNVLNKSGRLKEEKVMV